METRRDDFYSKTVPEEIDRLRFMSVYPNEIVFGILNPLMTSGTGIRVLDVGSGPDVGIWNEVIAKGGDYYPVDLSFLMLQAQKSNPLRRSNERGIHIQANVLNLPFPDCSFDIINMRFVLAHLPQTDRSSAIEECVRVSIKGLLVAEYDWSTLSSSRSTSTIKVFKEVSDRFANRFKADSYVGQQLEEIKLPSGCIRIIQRHSRPEQDLTEEFLAITQMCSAKCAITGDTELQAEFELLNKVARNERVCYVPPDIVTAFFKRTS